MSRLLLLAALTVAGAGCAERPTLREAGQVAVLIAAVVLGGGSEGHGPTSGFDRR